MNPDVSIVRCKSYEKELVYSAVREAIELLGGLTKFIKPKSKVLIKPNLLLPVDPEQAITTHPEVVRATAKILKDIDCKLYLGDSPCAWIKSSEDFDLLYRKTGIYDIAIQEDIKLIRFDNPFWSKKFALTSWLKECDYLVSLPKFKTHNLTVLTGAVKNLFGLVCGKYKIELHKRYIDERSFSKMLLDIYDLIRPTLTIVDGIISLEGDGPATEGRPKHTGLIIAGKDAVAIDSILSLIMGLQTYMIPTNLEASIRQVGITDPKKINILGINLSEVIQPFELPKVSFIKKIPPVFVEIAKRLVRFYPYINKKRCKLCGACIEVCPQKAIIFRDKKIFINYNKCIACFCCQEACRENALLIKRSIFTKILGL